MFFPNYLDLGKAARDLFNKGFNHGFLRVDACSKSGENREIEMQTSAVHTIATGRLAGNLDVKYRIPSYGMVLTEKWNTDNLLGTTIEVKDQFARGLKMTLDSWYAPQMGKRSGRIKAELLNKNATINCDIGLDTGPLVNFSAVTGLHGWIVGLQTAFDLSTNKIKGTSFAFGCVGSDYVLHSYVNDGHEFGASFHNQIAPNMEIGAHLGWSFGDQNVAFGLAAKYCPSLDTELKAKVDHDSKFAVSMTHHLSNHLKMIVSTQLGLGNLNDGNHKFGIGFEYRPCC